MSKTGQRKPRRFLKFGREVEIADVLRKHTSTADDSSVTYADGWSDEKVALSLRAGTDSDPAPTLDQVAAVRKRLLGPLVVMKPRAEGAVSREEFEGFKAQVEESLRAVMKLLSAKVAGADPETGELPLTNGKVKAPAPGPA